MSAQLNALLHFKSYLQPYIPFSLLPFVFCYVFTLYKVSYPSCLPEDLPLDKFFPICINCTHHRYFGTSVSDCYDVGGRFRGARSNMALATIAFRIGVFFLLAGPLSNALNLQYCANFNTGADFNRGK